jgi:hypothetical protein
MGKQKSQQGSGLLVIVIILAVALLGAVGYIFFDKVLNTAIIKNDMLNKNSSVILNEVASDKTIGTDVAVRYPEAWSMKHESSGPNDYGRYGDKSTITSPDGEIEVVLYVFQPTGFQSCVEIPKVTKQDLDEGNIDSNESLGYRAHTEGILFSDGKTHYNYYFGAFELAKINRTDCSDYENGKYLMNLPEIDSHNAVIVYMRFPKIEEEATSINKGYIISNIDDLKQIIKTDNYKIAKQIIQSFHKM